MHGAGGKQGIRVDDVWQALRQVQDPELGRDLVSLNMIRQIRIEGSCVHVTVELTTPACPLKAQIEASCRQQVLQIPGVTGVQIAFSARVRGRSPWQRRAPLPGVKRILAVAGGKGGVGKSTVSVHLATALAGEGHAVGLLDADIYGPSIPLLMGVTAQEKPRVEGKRIVPLVKKRVKVMSLGLIVEEETPLLYTGPMLIKSIERLLHEVVWGTLDYLVVDLPPGTGDVQLSLVQKVPLDGVLLVTTPQRAALYDVRRAIRLFQKARVPILGLIENMSLFACPHCQKTTAVFSTGGGRVLCQEMGIPYLGHIPLDPAIVRLEDQGDTLSPALSPFPTFARLIESRLERGEKERGRREEFIPLARLTK